MSKINLPVEQMKNVLNQILFISLKRSLRGACVLLSSVMRRFFYEKLEKDR